MIDEKTKPITVESLVKLLADNNKDELGAISGYLSLLDRISQGGLTSTHQYKEVVDAIKEIISDEMHHVKVLSELTTKLSGIEPNDE